jgi:hypothetical protein
VVVGGGMRGVIREFRHCEVGWVEDGLGVVGRWWSMWNDADSLDRLLVAPRDEFE